MSGNDSHYSPPADLYPFESHWFQRDGYRIHYIDEGSGPALLFLHGNPTFSFVYREVIRHLCDRFRCVAPDYPGFGLSDHPRDYGYTPAEHAAAIASLAEWLDLRDVVVVGYDWGGPIGLAFALEERTRVRGLTFSNSWFWPADTLPFRLFGLVMSSPVGRWLVMQQNLFIERTMPLGTARPMPERVRDVYRAVLPSPGSRRAVAVLASQVRQARTWFAMLEGEAPRQLAGIPMLLVWGTRDGALGREAILARWTRAFPHAEVVRLNGASHYVTEDDPEGFSRAIREHFGAIVSEQS